MQTHLHTLMLLHKTKPQSDRLVQQQQHQQHGEDNSSQSIEGNPN